MDSGVNMKAKIFDSFGLEFETESILREQEIPNELAQIFSKDHDASIESDYYTSGNSELTFDKKLKENFKRRTIGTEFVSRILDNTSETSEVMIRKLTDYLTEKGESFESARAGIHIHINLGGYNLLVLKNIIRLARFFEPAFFYLGSMGYKFRGLDNNAIYCRPITKFGPTIVNWGRKKAQSFNCEDLLGAKSTEEFWFLYGGIYEENPPNKYNPIRYNWITLYNLLSKGTVEFRVFNKTLNPEYIIAMVEICKAFCQKAFSYSNLPEGENSLYDTSKEGAFELFYKLAEYLELSERTRKIGAFIIKKSPDISLDKSYYYTHLRTYSFNPSDANYKFKTVTEEVKTPTFIDIHVLRGE